MPLNRKQNIRISTRKHGKQDQNKGLEHQNPWKCESQDKNKRILTTSVITRLNHQAGALSSGDDDHNGLRLIL